MKNKDFQIQLNKIAKIIDCEFGLVDEDGNIIFSSLKDDGRERIQIPLEFEEEQADIEFLEKEGYSYLKYSSSDISVILYIKSTKAPEENKRILQLAALAYENKEEMQKGLINDFYYSLIIDGSKDISQADINQYGIEGENGFLLVNVHISSPHPSSLDEIRSLLKGAFSMVEMTRIVRLSSQKYVVICGLNNKEDLENILEIADTIKATLASELMLDSYVSVGSIAKKLTDCNISYKDAETAREAGVIFELSSSSFIYDKLGVERLIYGMPIRNSISFLRETLGTDLLKDRNRKELLHTVKVFLMNNQNVSEAARALYIHRNTLVYRLEKFNKMTNLDSTQFVDGMKIAIALMIINYLEKKSPGEIGLE